MSGEGQAVFNTNQYSPHPIRIPVLADIPVIGPMFFAQTILVYIMYVMVVLLTIFLFRSRWGLRMRACGEHPKAADTVGIKVNRTRTLNTIFGSAIAGACGAFFTLGNGLGFTENISAGNGYIALAAMILGKWHPLGALAASVMFGFAKSVALLMPSLNSAIPSGAVNMIPYASRSSPWLASSASPGPLAAENIPLPEAMNIDRDALKELAIDAMKAPTPPTRDIPRGGGRRDHRWPVMSRAAMLRTPRSAWARVRRTE